VEAEPAVTESVDDGQSDPNGSGESDQSQ